MKPPAWMELVPPTKGEVSPAGRSVVFHFRVRRWHPAYWTMILRLLWGARR